MEATPPGALCTGPNARPGGALPLAGFQIDNPLFSSRCWLAPLNRDLSVFEAQTSRIEGGRSVRFIALTALWSFLSEGLGSWPRRHGWGLWLCGDATCGSVHSMRTQRLGSALRRAFISPVRSSRLCHTRTSVTLLNDTPAIRHRPSSPRRTGTEPAFTRLHSFPMYYGF